MHLQRASGVLVQLARAKNAATPAASGAAHAHLPARKGHANPMHIQAVDNLDMQEDAQEASKPNAKTQRMHDIS